MSQYSSRHSNDQRGLRDLLQTWWVFASEFRNLGLPTNYSRKGGKLRFTGTDLSDVVYSDAEMPGAEHKRLAHFRHLYQYGI